MNKIDLNGRTAVVTGGAQGFGKAITERFVASGAKVAIWDHDKALADKTAQAIGNAVSAFPVDVTDTAAVEKARDDTLAAFGKIDILVNNAGIAGDQQDGVGDRPLTNGARCCASISTALHLLQGDRAGDAATESTAASSTSPPSPARKAIRTPRTTPSRRPA
jgi:NAD(P)-dependent dehydrogenase (short-subunit alcohol dehydrogenase family)